MATSLGLWLQARLGASLLPHVFPPGRWVQLKWPPTINWPSYQTITWLEPDVSVCQRAAPDEASKAAVKSEPPAAR